MVHISHCQCLTVLNVSANGQSVYMGVSYQLHDSFCYKVLSVAPVLIIKAHYIEVHLEEHFQNYNPTTYTQHFVLYYTKLYPGQLIASKHTPRYGEEYT